MNDTGSSRQRFYTPEGFAGDRGRGMEPPRGRILFASCTAGEYLSRRAVDCYARLLHEAGSSQDILYLRDIDQRFSDSEVTVRLDHHVSGYDVYLFQALLNPLCAYAVDANYLALLVAARTFREHGAHHVTAVTPYLAYARQDKPTAYKREPTTARLLADLTIASGLDRVIAWHPHSSQIPGFYGSTPTNMLDPLSLFLEEFGAFRNDNRAIAVAPDAGASKLIMHFARQLGLSTAITSKYRPEPEIAVATDIIGDFRGKRIAIILDDIMSSAQTLYSVATSLVRDKGIEEIHIGISHNLCSEQAREKLLDLRDRFGLARAVFTNSIPQTPAFRDLPFVTVHCLSETLARAINRIHYNRSVSEAFYPL
jgi:ribose-phosphate pyrophosphokinase